MGSVSQHRGQEAGKEGESAGVRRSGWFRGLRTEIQAALILGTLGIVAAVAAPVVTTLLQSSSPGLTAPGATPSAAAHTSRAPASLSPTRPSASLTPQATLARTLAVRGYIPESVEISPDGKTAATATTVSGGGGGNTYLWNLATHGYIVLHDPGSQGVQAVAFGRDGATLAAGDADGTTYLWNVSTHAVIARLHDPGSQGVQAVAFGRDGATLAAGDADGTTYLWNVSTHAVIARLHDPRDLERAGGRLQP